jgi:hypothetical protein
MEEKYQIVGLWDHEEPKSYTGNFDNFGHITVRPVKYLDSCKVRNFSDSFPDFDLPLFLAGLQLKCQYHVEKGKAGDPYGYRLEYRVHSIEQPAAEKMLKTFKRIEKKMAGYIQEWGNPVDFGSYAMRFLKAIGAATVIRSRGQGRTRASYDDNEYQSLAIIELPWLVKDALFQVQEKIDAKAAA